MAEFHAAPRQDMTIGIADVAAHARRGLAVAGREGFGGASAARSNPLTRWRDTFRREELLSENIDERGISGRPRICRSDLPYISGIAPEHIVSYCGSGVRRATTNRARACGRVWAKLYPGSWVSG